MFTANRTRFWAIGKGPFSKATEQGTAIDGTLFGGLFGVVFSFLTATVPFYSGAEEVIEFKRDIRPILGNYCFHCHGPDEETRKADLRLDTFEDAIRDLGGYAAIVPGKPEASDLIRKTESHDSGEVMPPPKSKKPLSAKQVSLLRQWIAQGARYEPHWAFQPLEKSKLPEVKKRDWIINEIDRFVLHQLERNNIEPSPEARREVLMRRLYLDLLGLLPSPEEVTAFVKDRDPRAYDRLVDRLLDSPHYGERWGRHWLDQARYADSNGYSVDGEREMWPYRDWVIEAMNRDMPFDQFTIEQLAGDLLPSPAKSQLVATAFHRNTLINQEGGTDPEQFRVEAAMDRVATTGAVWLGLTVGCAQCHTHKFDPVSQREFFQLYAFFNSGTDRNSTGKTLEVLKGEIFGHPVDLGPKPVSGKAREKLKADWEKQELAKSEGEDAALRTALSMPESKRDEAARAMVEKRFVAAHPEAKPKAKTRDQAQLMIMEELPKPRDTYLLTRGDFTRPDLAGGKLFPGGLSAVKPALPSRDGQNRLDLARWLVDRENPLTPRVTINRIWMRYFGVGLVETEEDFGTQGTLPSHPELLDWLGNTFMERGWSMKTIHRLIVSSATYRQQSHARPDLVDHDPRNQLLARQNRLRVEAELVRDVALCASGALHREIGGPGVFPPQPEGVYAFTQNKKNWATSSGKDRYRRTMYTQFYRSAPYPLLTTFDSPDFSSVCTRRNKSNNPLQALNMANDPVFMDLARQLARRVTQEAPSSIEASIRRAFFLCLGREPEKREAEVLRDYHSDQLASWMKEPEAARLFSGAGKSDDAARGAALVSVARAIMNTDNFITRE